MGAFAAHHTQLLSPATRTYYNICVMAQTEQEIQLEFVKRKRNVRALHITDCARDKIFLTCECVACAVSSSFFFLSFFVESSFMWTVWYYARTYLVNEREKNV